MNYFYYIIIFACSLTCFTDAVYAQEPFFRQIAIPGTNPTFRINAICQDSAKYIWIGTNDGLLKYNGIEFVKIKFPSTKVEFNITSLSALPAEGILAGTSNGMLFSIKNDIATAISLLPYKIEVQISSILTTAPDEIWFSTIGEGLFHLTGDSIRVFKVEDGLSDEYIYCIESDFSGNIWVGSDAGLTVISKNNSEYSFKNIDTNLGLPDNIIRKLKRGPGNSMGIGMEEKGFCLLDINKQKFEITKVFENWSQGPVSSLLILENEFWIGTQKSGIIDFEFQAGRRIRQFSEQEGFAGMNVNAMLKDHEGNIWIGAGNELYLSPGEKIEFKKRINKTLLKTIHTILVDKLENIWFSNDSGVYFYTKDFKDGFKIQIPQVNSKSKKINVISLYEDSFGYIWMGTFDYGVFRYDPITREWQNFSERDGLVNSNVLSIDGQGNEIWFATLGGVSKCVISDSLFNRNIKFTGYTEQNGLGNNFIYKVFVDSKNRVWFGTDGKGITIYEDGKFTNFSEAQGLKSKVIYSITEDKKGMIWLSSSGEVIYRYNGKSFRNLAVSQGLGDLNVTSLATDNKGNIIIVHKKGIDVLNPDNFYLQSYGSEMGIEVIDPDVNVVDADSYGNIWIGTTQGMIKLKLDQRIGENKPVLILNKVLCFLEKVDTNKVHVFDYDRNHISFDYTTLWFADPQKVSYQYKLEGYNREWISTRDRFITFPNLSPGKYTFMLRTSVNTNFSNAVSVNYSFEITYPIWQKTWFIATTIILIALLLYLFILYREHRLQKKDQLKREKIESQYEILKNQVNPHFLFNSFNTLITVIEDNPGIAIEYVNKLSDFFRSILMFREKDLILISEELLLVETYIFLQQKRYGDNFKVSVKLPAIIKEQYLIPPLALQILIENCLKHNAVSRETKLNVEIYSEKDDFLIVKNNINPKFTKEISTGIGLQNLKNRYQLLQGSGIIINETVENFIVKLPLIKNKKE